MSQCKVPSETRGASDPGECLQSPGYATVRPGCRRMCIPFHSLGGTLEAGEGFRTRVAPKISRTFSKMKGAPETTSELGGRLLTQLLGGGEGLQKHSPSGFSYAIAKRLEIAS